MTPLEIVLAHVHGAKKQTGGWYQARCPAHEDRGPSLSIREAVDGKVLVNCFAGCSFDAIVSGMGLEPAALWPAKDIESEQRAMLEQSALRRRYRGASAAARVGIEAEQIAKAEAGVRRREALEPFVPLRAVHVNAARCDAATVLGITLEPVLAFEWEGGPYDSDPWWPFMFERGLRWAREEARGVRIRDESMRHRATLLAAAWLRGENPNLAAGATVEADDAPFVLG